VRIIVAGTPDKQWPREWTTPCCKSVLEIEPNDIKEDTDYTGGHNSWFVTCPVCGAQPDVPDSFHYDGERWKKQQERIQA
jgi:hypothetical protein